MKTLILLFSVLFTTMSFAQVPNYVPANGLVGWWPFNGNANDESGNGNNGTNNGATLTTDRNGVANQAYSFDGYNDLIRIQHQNTLNLMGDYSISVWYKGNYQNIFNNNWCFIAKRDDNGNCCSPNVPYQIAIPFNSTNYAVPLMVYANGNYTFSTLPNTSPISLDQWQNLIITNTSDFLKFYINGQIIFSENISSLLRAPNTSDLLIGSVNRELGAEWMNGKLDDIGIWNRALTDCEIQNLYTSTNPTNTTTASACDSYLWNGTNYTSSGVYTGTTANCVTQALNLTINTNTSSSISQTALDSYTWPVNNQTYTTTGVYTAVIPNAAGCDSTITLNLTMSFTGINDLITSKLSIYPNPTNGDFTITGLELVGTVSSLSLTDMNGKIVKVLDTKATKFSMASIKPGVYFLNIISGNKQEVLKIVKE